MMNPRTATRALLIALITLALGACSSNRGADAVRDELAGVRRVDVTLCLSTTSAGTQTPTAAICETTTATFGVRHGFMIRL